MLARWAAVARARAPRRDDGAAHDRDGAGRLRVDRACARRAADRAPRARCGKRRSSIACSSTRCCSPSRATRRRALDRAVTLEALPLPATAPWLIRTDPDAAPGGRRAGSRLSPTWASMATASSCSGRRQPARSCTGRCATARRFWRSTPSDLQQARRLLDASAAVARGVVLSRVSPEIIRRARAASQLPAWAETAAPAEPRAVRRALAGLRQAIPSRDSDRPRERRVLAGSAEQPNGSREHQSPARALSPNPSVITRSERRRRRHHARDTSPPCSRAWRRESPTGR